MTDQTVTVLHARGVLDVDTGDVIESGYVRIAGKQIIEVSADRRTARDADELIELPDLTLIPGLMDMEVNLFMGGPGATLIDPVLADPAKRTLRAAANALRTLRAGFTTVRNLGLFVKTGGYLLDVSLMEAIEEGLVEGCRIVPAGHAIAATGGHLDPTTFLRLAPGIMPVSVEEGVADGVEEVRKCVRYQIKHGAQVIKCCASGGVMSHTGANHAQHYSDEELRVIADEAHRRGIRVATHCHGDMAARAAIAAGIDCIEHGFGIGDETIQLMIANGTFLVSTTALTENWDVSNQPPALQAKAADVFPKAQDSLARALKAGVKVACGSDAPAIWHGRNAQELAAIVNRGATPLQAIRAATTVSADLIDRPDLGRIAPEMIADIVGVPGDPLSDITVTQRVKFVMKDGRVYKR